MSLYSKKLHIKKPNNQIQIANLYTDKNDVGSNYLTLNDNNNIVYVPLINNGDVDCKINKNNQIFKVNSTANIRQNGSATINFTSNPQTFTVPDNVHIVNLYFLSAKHRGWVGQYIDKSINVLIDVTPNKTYTCQYAERADTSNPDKISVTIYFASLKFTSYYRKNVSLWNHYTNSFVLNWYANEPTNVYYNRYSAD